MFTEYILAIILIMGHVITGVDPNKMIHFSSGFKPVTQKMTQRLNFVIPNKPDLMSFFCAGPYCLQFMYSQRNKSLIYQTSCYVVSKHSNLYNAMLILVRILHPINKIIIGYGQSDHNYTAEAYPGFSKGVSNGTMKLGSVVPDADKSYMHTLFKIILTTINCYPMYYSIAN